MDTKEITREMRLRSWAEIMRRRGESGKSVRSWCRENEIKERIYYYWQRKLREAACEHLSGTQNEGKQKSLTVPGFAQVSLRSETEQDSVRGNENFGRISIEISGLKISADSGYPAEKLAELLRELSGSC